MKTSRRRFLGTTSAIAIGYTIYGKGFFQQQKIREEIEKEINELVDRFLPVYKNCAQTSFYALNQVFDLKSEKFTKAMGSLPGIALRGETCGTVSGSLCAISLVFSDEVPGKALADKPSFEFCKRFETEFGSTRCRDVIEHVSGKKYTLQKPDDYLALAQDRVYEHCPGVIKKAALIAADIIIS
jgi:C_GCAxxG_C_C family probable redox protein